MPDKFNRSLDRFGRDNDNFLGGLYNNVRLIIRLLKDKRVHFLLKLLPIGALIYLIVPVDFLPINPLEDAVVLWLGGTLFIELCPNEIVEEHRQALKKASSEDGIIKEGTEDVVEGEFKDVPPSQG